MTQSNHECELAHHGLTRNPILSLLMSAAQAEQLGLVPFDWLDNMLLVDYYEN